ncbi:mitochondrial 54S ribosomal protein YmL28 [Sugiyamaella lignohabitans]|uniref:Large ribosomal subunit protein mL40 n=1 Tax=Sugiyamaella lignohabitans TaxID=796027 RepID=A0A167FMV5_9ASCO|nr:mitochondrial 54S ribosomal protein YmL28 [Sugiyamaella lignohabitans]ANB15492.1 mitochondrial 54S ribosomal protein YmL28 [Sugiyamaella lignohabitans]
MFRIQSSLRAMGPTLLGSARPSVVGCNNANVKATANLVLSRGKRTKARALAPGAQRIINMLSVFSAHKKQPRRIKLAMEDLIRHNVVQKAWSIFMRDKKLIRTERLKSQYKKIEEAAEELKSLNGYLHFEATKRELGKRFSPEMRIPTETPPNEIWHEDWKVTDIYAKKR